jgi:hypothetical protein
VRVQGDTCTGQDLITRPLRRAAEMSTDNRYRYTLSRDWNSDLPRLGFIMLNPSTASALVDDPTIRRCMGFADRNGFGSIIVRNLYAYRATQPTEVFKLKMAERLGENERYLASVPTEGPTVCAWGVLGGAAGKDLAWQLARQGATLLHLGSLTNDGHPRHPLYLRGDARLNDWRIELDEPSQLG